MAKEYIEREAALKIVKKTSGDYAAAFSEIRALPAADVVEVVHGYWFFTEYEYLDCSVCGDSMYTGCNSKKEAELLKHHWKRYCPNCGAKMDGEREEI